MKKKKSQAIQEITHQRLKSLNILGITTGQLDKAKAELQKEQTDSSEHPRPADIESEKKRELNISKNYLKVDSDVVDKLVPTLDVYEQSVYVRLYRLSYGHGRNYCTVGYQNLCESCNITKTGVIGAVKRLLDKGWIKQLDFNHALGTTYRVFLPVEKGFESKTIIHDKKEKSVSLKGIPSKSISSEGIPLRDIVGVSPEGILSKNTPKLELASNLNPSRGVSSEGIPPGDTNIDHKIYLKDPLSPEDITNSFYEGIGHSRITKEKRERAKECIKELTEENFSLEDIQFAIEWTLKNKTEKLYDFSIIKHTIGEAMSAKEEIEKRETDRQENERLAQEEKEEAERLEKESALMESHKAKMNQKDRDELRERALEEIRNTKGVKAEFITDILINAKEKEILKRELNNSQ